MNSVVKNEKTCYKVFQETLAWDSAKSRCEDQQSTLTTIHTSNISTFIANTLLKSRDLTKEAFWVGGAQHPDGQEPDIGWDWLQGPPLLNWVNWAQNQPDDVSFGGGENCLAVSGASLAWYDEACSLPLTFICMRPGQSGG